MKKLLLIFILIWVITFSFKQIYAQIPISTLEQLQNIGNIPDYPLNGNYILINDIDASATKSWNNGKGFKPIGDTYHEFTGIFDGDNKTISNLYINRPDETMIGLFSSNFNSYIKNLTLYNIHIIGKSKVGAISGIDGNIINCRISGEVKAIEWTVGGIIGTFGYIENCSYSGIVNGGMGQVGGLIGEEGYVENSSSSGIVSGDLYVGGIMGDGNLIKNSYSTCKVKGRNNVGGLFGKGGNDHNCYSTGIVEGQNIVGGLGGINYGLVENCYATGPTSGTQYVDGLLGISIAVYSASVEDCFFDLNTTGRNDGHYRGRTTEEMMNPATFTNWDFQNVWWMVPGKSYPVLRPVRYVGINVKPAQTYRLPAEFKISFSEPVRNFTFDDVDFSTSTVQGIKGMLTPDDVTTTITAMDCFTTWTLRLTDAASTTGIIVMRVPVAAAMNAANYPTTESATLIQPLIEPTYGDLNADGLVNTIDRDILIALILDPQSIWWTRLLPDAADLNKDGIIDVADLITLIAILK